MSVRTSAVVALGLSLLTVVGIGTIFGESIGALWAPVAAESAAKVPNGATPTAPGASPRSGAALPAPATTDAGAGATGDSSS